MSDRSPEASCESARRATAEFLEGSLKGSQEATWRAHLEGCRECSDHYRTAAETLAGMGRGLREQRVEREEARRRESFRQDVRDAMQPRQRLSLGRLRILLYPALMFLLIMAFFSGEGRGRRSGLRLQIEEGQGVLGGEPLLAPPDGLVLEAGQLLELPAGSRVRIDGRGRVLFLDGPARMLVESGTRQRIRLLRGVLVQEGAGEIFTAQGVVEASADGAQLRLEIGKDGLLLDALQERILFQDAAGGQELATGETLRRGAS